MANEPEATSSKDGKKAEFSIQTFNREKRRQWKQSQRSFTEGIPTAVQDEGVSLLIVGPENQGG